MYSREILRFAAIFQALAYESPTDVFEPTPKKKRREWGSIDPETGMPTPNKWSFLEPPWDQLSEILNIPAPEHTVFDEDLRIVPGKEYHQKTYKVEEVDPLLDALGIDKPEEYGEYYLASDINKAIIEKLS